MSIEVSIGFGSSKKRGGRDRPAGAGIRASNARSSEAQQHLFSAISVGHSETRNFLHKMANSSAPLLDEVRDGGKIAATMWGSSCVGTRGGIPDCLTTE